MKVASKIERLIDAGAVVEWRPIAGYVGLYEINNLGDVRSLSRVDPRGHLRRERILKPVKMSTGYIYVGLCKKGDLKQYSVHRLVMQAFVGPCPKGMEVNHRDEDKTNNSVSNLEYVTHKQNMNHGNSRERTTRAQSVAIESYDLATGKTIKKYPSINEAERRDGYNKAHIVDCIKGRRKSCGGFGWRIWTSK